ncbi:MAG: SRPBCC domain-containing protein [Tagaea sp.]|nr:SRPBCC domain-containing protein [Tagaea sp.]
MKITIEALIEGPLDRAWRAFTMPEHIVKWNFASDDWHCPRAENDLRVGGRYVARMEAKDGSSGFDFEGVYTQIAPHKSLAFVLGDDRHIRSTFEVLNGATKVTTQFDAETEHPIERQRDGWQAILNNFAKYAERLRPSDRDDIESVCKRLGQAHREKDAAAIVACFAPDALIFDLAPPLSSRGMDRAEVAAWLATWDGPVAVDATDFDAVVSGDLAWTTALNRIRGRKTNGATVDIWFRATMCLRKRDGEWRIVHDHSSTPFYMDGSFRAATDLTPVG